MLQIKNTRSVLILKFLFNAFCVAIQIQGTKILNNTVFRNSMPTDLAFKTKVCGCFLFLNELATFILVIYCRLWCYKITECVLCIIYSYGLLNSFAFCKICRLYSFMSDLHFELYFFFYFRKTSLLNYANMGRKIETQLERYCVFKIESTAI